MKSTDFGNLESLHQLVLKHESYHQHSDTYVKDRQCLTRCRLMSAKANRVLYKAIRKKDTIDDLSKMQFVCSIMNGLLSGKVCPHYLGLFSDVSRVSSFIIQLYPLFMHEKLVTIYDDIFQVLCKLIQLLQRLDLAAFMRCFSDLVILSDDLQVVLDPFSNCFQPGTVYPVVGCFENLVLHLNSSAGEKNLKTRNTLNYSACSLNYQVLLGGKGSVYEIQRYPKLEISSINIGRSLLIWTLSLCEKSIQSSQEYLVSHLAYSDFLDNLIIVREAQPPFQECGIVAFSTIKLAAQEPQTSQFRQAQIWNFILRNYASFSGSRDLDLCFQSLKTIPYADRYLVDHFPVRYIVERLKLLLLTECCTRSISIQEACSKLLTECLIRFPAYAGVTLKYLLNNAKERNSRNLILICFIKAIQGSKNMKDKVISLTANLNAAKYAERAKEPILKRYKSILGVSTATYTYCLSDDFESILEKVICCSPTSTLLQSFEFCTCLSIIIQFSGRSEASRFISNTLDKLRASINSQDLKFDIVDHMVDFLLICSEYDRSTVSNSAFQFFADVAFKSKFNGSQKLRATNFQLKNNIPQSKKLCDDETMFNWYYECFYIRLLVLACRISCKDIEEGLSWKKSRYLDLWCDGLDHNDHYFRSCAVRFLPQLVSSVVTACKIHLNIVLEHLMSIIMSFIDLHEKSFEKGELICITEALFNVVIASGFLCRDSAHESPNCPSTREPSRSSPRERVPGILFSIASILSHSLDATWPWVARVHLARAAVLAIKSSSAEELEKNKGELGSLVRLSNDESAHVRAVFSTHAALFGVNTVANAIADFAKLQKTSKTPATFIVSLGSIASVCDTRISYDRNLFESVLIRLLELWKFSLGEFESACCYDQIVRIMRNHNSSWRSLCLKFPQELYPRLLDVLVFPNEPNKDFMLGTLFNDEVDTNLVLVKGAEFVLPLLVLNKCQSKIEVMAAVVVSKWSKMRNYMGLQEMVYRLIKEYLPYIVKEIMMVNDGKKFASILEFLLSFMPDDTTLRDMIQHTPLKVVKLLALELVGERRAVAKTGFRQLAHYLNDDDAMDSGVIPRRHFLGLMTMLGSQLVENKDSSRRQALKCVHEILGLFQGSSLDPYLPKVMSTLNVALRDRELMHGACKTWDKFIRMLSMKTLAANIGPIVATVLSCIVEIDSIAVCPKNVIEAKKVAVGILSYIFISRRKELKSSFRNVPFVPMSHELSHIKDIIDYETGGSLRLPEQLAEITSVLYHWNVGVREMALSHLLKLLLGHSNEVQHLISESDSAPSVIIFLVRGILRLCCVETNTKVKLLCGNCLGAIGAIDPSRMPLDIFYDPCSSPSGFHQRKKSVGEYSLKDLTYTLIEEHLIPGLRAALKNTDSIAFAIQELLRFLSSLNSKSVNDDDTSSASMPNWMLQHFQKKQLMDTVEPYWSTNYSVCGAQLQPAALTTFYDSSSTYEEWLTLWAKRLISLSAFAEERLFQACRTALADLPSMSRFLLPYLIQNVLRSGRSQDFDEIKREVLSALSDHDYDEGRKDHVKYGFSNTGTESPSSSRHHQCAQTIFSTLDELSDWVSIKENKKTSNSYNSKAPTVTEVCDYEKENLEEFLKDIPRRLLAEAAFSINAFARALLYFEVYLRQQGYFPTMNTGSRHRHGGEIIQGSNPLSRNDANFLQVLYSCTDEPDGLLGMTKCRRLMEAVKLADTNGQIDGASTLNLMDRIIDHENLAQWQDALLCYEQILQVEHLGSQYSSLTGDENSYVCEGKARLYAGSIRCMIMLGRFECALQHIGGILSQFPKFWPCMHPYAVECAWRLSRWDYLEFLLKNIEREELCIDNPEVYLSRTLLSLHQRNSELFQKNVDHSRMSLMGPLAAASVESYQRVYPILQRLHMLHEVEVGFRVMQQVESSVDSTCANTIWDSQCPWDSRLNLLAPSMKFREPVLAMRRVILQELNLPEKIAHNWLKCAKMARSSKSWQAAITAVMNARVLKAPNAIIEDAKILESQGNVHGAVQLLEPLNVKVDGIRIAGNSQEDEFHAKSLLLTTDWLHYSRQKQGDEVISRYKGVIRLRPEWEKGYFALARYAELLLRSAKRQSNPHGADNSSSKTEPKLKEETLSHKYLMLALENYVKSLQFGTKYLFQSLPKFLTLWFEYGERFYEGKRNASHLPASMATIKNVSITEKALRDIETIVSKAIKVLPVYEWMCCFPQVTSRIVHPNPLVVEGVKTITMKVLSLYPLQAMWQVLGLSRSLNNERKSRAREIVAAAQKQLSRSSNTVDLAASQSLSGGIQLYDELISLAHKNPESKKSMSVRISVPRHCNILIPQKDTLLVRLPKSGKATSDAEYDAFPVERIFLKLIGEKVEVMMSKEKPKKFIMIGSDGNSYPFLCKREQHGDLRKDARMMEINMMINKLLQKSSEGRKRNLRLRTYSVLILNEEIGILEWVPNTTALRGLVSKIYRTETGYLRPIRLTREIKEAFTQMQSNFADNPVAMAAYYQRKILSLPAFTPRFHQWFLNSFSDPTAWFESRLAFCRSAASWSMVGHVVGLGDRHGENLLIDCATGECVHVDFDCLFDKGLELHRPEIVPFRLTPNMIDAMGLTGYEGVFRKVSEVTMSLLRINKDTLLSVLESFIHDPLVEWGRSGKVQKMNKPQRSEVSHKTIGKGDAQAILRTIDERLRGIYNLGKNNKRIRAKSNAQTLPLSVQGQVDLLIHEAVSNENLAQMYIGWMPFL